LADASVSEKHYVSIIMAEMVMLEEIIYEWMKGRPIRDME
jgi:hypothetical protein